VLYLKLLLESFLQLNENYAEESMKVFTFSEPNPVQTKIILGSCMNAK
jgi:hypothetical protein